MSTTTAGRLRSVRKSSEAAQASRWNVDNMPGWVPWAGMLAGLPLMTWAYSYAATHGVGDQLHYSLFWGGLCLGMVPMLLRVLSNRASRNEQLLLTLSMGIITYIPKFLRDPGGILYHDEFPHIHEVQLIEKFGRVGEPNPTIKIVSDFPGLHTLTAFIQEVGGLGTAPSVAIVICVAHTLGLIAIFLLAESALGSARAGAIAALLYTLNSSFLYFDTEFGYESLALPFMFWTLLSVEKARRSVDIRSRRGWFALGLVLYGGCMVTHHLTTYVTVIILTIAAVYSLRPSSRRADRGKTLMTVWFAVIAAVLAAVWAVFVAPGVVNYLLPRVTGGFQQLATGSGVRTTHGKAHLFQASHIPDYERVCAVLLAPVAVIATLGGIWMVWKRYRHKLDRFDDMHLALITLGLLYLPSFPLLLSIQGGEGARRSWASSYLGVAILVTPWLIYLWDRRPRARRRVVSGIVLGFLITLIGGVAIGQDEDYRFPGPYVYGSDTRSITPELRDLAATFPTQWGYNNKTIADRYNGLLVGTIGQQEVALPSNGFPAWNLYFNAYPTQFLLGELITSQQKFMIIDSQMAKYLPRLGVYFDPQEPGADYRTTPVPLKNLTKYEDLPWTIKVLATNHLSLYRYDFATIKSPEGAPYR